MNLKNALANHQFEFPRVPDGGDGALARVCDLIERTFADSTAPRPPALEDLAFIRRMVYTHFRHLGTLDGLHKRHLRRVPWFLFTEDPEAGPPFAAPLADDAGFCQAWMKWLHHEHTLRTSAGSRVLPSLIHNLLLHDPTQHPAPDGLRFWRNGLDAIWPHLHQPGLLLWRDRCRDYRLLEPEGPVLFAQRLYRGELPFLELCDRYGITGEVINGHFVRRGLDALLQLMAGYADEQHGLSVLQLQKFLHGFRDHQGQLQRFDSHFASRLAEALLHPFRYHEAETPMRNLLRDFLVSYLGDPRVTPAAWHDISPRARKVMLAWLAGRPTRIDDRLWMFLQEAARQLADLEPDLVRIGRSRTPDTSLLNRVAQRLHSIRGVAEFFDLVEVIDLGNAMEAILDQLRNDAPREPDTADRLLTILNDLRTIVTDVLGESHR
jgi:hypothetical protein